VNRPEKAFGQLACDTLFASALLDLETSTGKQGQFSQVDALIGQLIAQSLQGERIASLTRQKDRLTLSIHGLRTDQHIFIEEYFSIEKQQARGAWFLPKDASLKVGWLNLPYYFHHYPRYATGLATEERGRIAFQTSGEAVMVWSILQPFFEQLFRPFELRGHDSGTLDREKQIQIWGELDSFLRDLNFAVSEEMAVMRYGGGWSRLRAAEQIQAKQHLLDAFALQVNLSHASLYRACQIQTLLKRYYQRAKKGAPLRRQIVTKQVQPTLAGYFGGDWLAFLSYVEEEPHPDERIVTALPEPRLYVGGKSRAAEVASEHGLPVEEIQRMLATYWGDEQVMSPVEQRVDALRWVWKEFDEIHARQQSGMKSLWGFVDDTGFTLHSMDDASTPHQPGLYKQLLSPDLLGLITRLWGTIMLSRWPERIVSEPAPYRLMAEAFGPALKFWHGCALTTWFICEGPSSRTDLTGLAEYYQREIAELDSMECPIDPSLFRELVQTESLLGTPEPLTTNLSNVDVGGMTLTFEMSRGTRRDGFERLRDIVTRYRRSWSAKYLEQYLRACWEVELRGTATAYSQLLEEKGRPPTLKQFARHATVATNHWFGGNVSGLYAAIGEKIPQRPQRIAIMPNDPEDFAWSVFERLGGKPFTRKTIVESQEEVDQQAKEQQRNGNLLRLSELSVSYVQLEEALGRPPTLREFGQTRFQWPSSVLAKDMDAAWLIYKDSIDMAKRAMKENPRSGVEYLPPQHIIMPTLEEKPDQISETTTEAVSRKERRSLWKRLFGRLSEF
jgi:hypothetical protein